MAKKPDIVKVIEGVDYYLLKRLDVTEKELKTLGSIYLVLLSASTVYLLSRIGKLREEIKEFKNSKGD